MDFYDRLKSLSRGYASFDYDFLEFRPSDLVKLDILLNGDPVDALSLIVHRDKAYERGKALAEKLKEVIPRQMFEVVDPGGDRQPRHRPRDGARPLRKNVTAKCYGGDITAEAQASREAEGRQEAHEAGRNVEIPQEAFLVGPAVLGASHDDSRSITRRRGRPAEEVVKVAAEVRPPRVHRGDPRRGAAGPRSSGRSSCRRSRSPPAR